MTVTEAEPPDDGVKGIRAKAGRREELGALQTAHEAPAVAAGDEVQGRSEAFPDRPFAVDVGVRPSGYVLALRFHPAPFRSIGPMRSTGGTRTKGQALQIFVFTLLRSREFFAPQRAFRGNCGCLPGPGAGAPAGSRQRSRAVSRFPRHRGPRRRA